MPHLQKKKKKSKVIYGTKIGQEFSFNSRFKGFQTLESLVHHRTKILVLNGVQTNCWTLFLVLECQLPIKLH
ncbi:hypothetical protein Hanom_Chr16g01464841 [Helianthus anomalus]